MDEKRSQRLDSLVPVWRQIDHYLERGQFDAAKQLLKLHGRVPSVQRLPWWAVEELAEKLCEPKYEADRRRAISLVAIPAGWPVREVARRLGVSLTSVAAMRQRARRWDPEMFEYLQDRIRQLLYDFTGSTISRLGDKLKAKRKAAGSV